jgi:uncharacterized protein DUF3710
VKFRRSKSDREQPDVEVSSTDAAEQAVAEDHPRAKGPWDASEIEIAEDDRSRIDLGSLVITPREGLELQLQVDEQRGHVVAVVLAGPEGAVELRPFAAPRNGDIWEDVRSQIAAEVTRRGGTATEAVGPWGPELRVVLTMTTPEGQSGQQPSRVFGIAGPRWLLRATFFGKPALEPDDHGLVEQALRDVVVRRGDQALAPGEALPLSVPPDLSPREG